MALALTTVTLNHHHPLAFVAGNQTVSDELLQGGNVLRVKQSLQKSQPAGRRGCIGIVSYRQATADNLRPALCKGSIQKQRAVCQMDAVSLRWKVLRQRSQLHQLHDIADLAGNVADRTAFQLLKNFSSQG